MKSKKRHCKKYLFIENSKIGNAKRGRAQHTINWSIFLCFDENHRENICYGSIKCKNGSTFFCTKRTVW